MKKGKKATKDEGKEEDQVKKPTKALSAYIFFSNEMVPKIKNEENVDHKTAMKMCGERWN